MQNRTDEIFNFKLMTPLAYMGVPDITEIETELHKENIFIFSVFTNPKNPFFIEVQKQMYRENPEFKIKLIVLGIRYNKEFIA